MEWKQPFIIYRITPEGKLFQVYETADLKQARYWLTYIAQPGDVLCRTPVHPKHSKQNSKPEYCAHKESSGKSSSVEKDWGLLASKLNFSRGFPDSPTDTAIICTDWPEESAATPAEIPQPMNDTTTRE